MQARDDLDNATVETVVESVGEAREEGSPQACGDLGEGLRLFPDKIDDLFESAHEGSAKARTLSVVPFTGQRNVVGRLRPEADNHS